MHRLRRLLRLAASPVRGVLNPRFADVNRRIGSTKQALHEESTLTRHVLTERSSELERSLGGLTTSNTESLAFVGKQLEDLAGRLADVEARMANGYDRLFEDFGAAALDRRVDELIASDGEVLDATTARLLNFAESHRGFAARRKLWLNPPVTLDYEEGAVRVGGVNERIVEVPYALRALGSVPAGGRVLDVGGAESSLSLSLASLGYETVALDLHTYPFAHPRLEVVASRLETWEPELAGFDAILCVSTVEHIGLGWYGEEPEDGGADRRALERLSGWLRPGGLMVITVPYGTAGVDEVQRTYDALALDQLVAGWVVEDRTIVAREAESGAWTVRDDVQVGPAVAMVTVRLASDR
jgi:2-polyprenyl-3-methyl-5-hydroxy-6-metoxy-1,4-benzoquinol methylase